jgi:hypothetical protein
MKVRGYPLLLEFPIREGDGKSIIDLTLDRTQQASGLKPLLPGNRRVKYLPIGCFNVLLQSGLDRKINV